MSAAAATLDPSDTYRRQARRLRCRFAGQPGRLQQSLKRLAEGSLSSGAQVARRADVTPASDRRPARPGGKPLPCPYLASAQTGPARQFADHLLDRMPPATSVLRYSQRLEFLRAARRLGVSRFEANLLIAAVLERHRAKVVETDPSGGDSVMAHLAALLLGETALLLAVGWSIFH